MYILNLTHRHTNIHPLSHTPLCVFPLGNLFPVVADKLNQAPLPVVPFSTCSTPQYWGDTVRLSMICAGYELPDELKSACQVLYEAINTGHRQHMLVG